MTLLDLFTLSIKSSLKSKSCAPSLSKECWQQAPSMIAYVSLRFRLIILKSVSKKTLLLLFSLPHSRSVLKVCMMVTHSSLIHPVDLTQKAAMPIYVYFP